MVNELELWLKEHKIDTLHPLFNWTAVACKIMDAKGAPSSARMQAAAQALDLACLENERCLLHDAEPFCSRGCLYGVPHKPGAK